METTAKNTIVLRMPDGILVRFPADTSKETIKQMMVKKYPDWAKEQGYGGLYGTPKPEETTKTFTDPFSGQERPVPRTFVDDVLDYAYEDKTSMPDVNVLGVNPLEVAETVGKSAIRLGHNLAAGASTGVGNLVTTGALALDTIGATDGAAEATYKKMVDTGVITDNKKSDLNFVETIVRTAGEVLPGAYLGTKLAKPIVGTIVYGKSLTASAAKLLGISLAGGAASGLSMNPDENKIFTGDDALFRLIPGLTVDENGSFNEQLMAKKMNLVIDNMVTSGMADSVLGVTGLFWEKVLRKIPANIKTYFSNSEQTEKVVEGFLEAVAKIDLEDTHGQVTKKMTAAIDGLKNSKEFRVAMNELDEAIPEMVRNKPTIMSIISMFDDMAKQYPEGSLEREQYETIIQGFKNHALSHKGPNLEQGMEQVVNASRRGLQQIVDTTGGGATNIDQTMKTGVQEMALDETAPILKKMSEFETRKMLIQKQTADALVNDPLLREAAEGVVDVRGGKLTGKAEEIVDKLMTAGRSLMDRKRELFAAIPDDVVGSSDLVEKALAKTKLPESLVDKITKANGNFKVYDSIILEDLNPMISSAYNSGDALTGKALSDLKKSMSKDQLDFITEGLDRKSGQYWKDQAAVKAIKDAREFFTTKVTKWYDNPILSQVLDANDMVAKKHHYPTVGARKGLVEGIEKSAELGGKSESVYILDTISEMNDFVIAKDGISKGTYSKDFEDYATLKILDYLKSEITDQGDNITPETIVALNQKIKSMSNLFSPEKLKYFEDLLTKARDGIVDTKKLDDMLGKLANSKDEITEKFYKNILNDFFESEGIPKSNQIQSFKNFFSKAGNEGKLEGLLQRAANKPLVLKAIKGGYAQALKDEAFSGAGGRKVIDAFLEVGSDGRPVQSIGKYAEQVFGDTGYKVLSNLMRMSQEVLEMEGKQALLLQPGGIQKSAIKATNTVLTWIFGVLNPTAARIRTLTSEYFSANDVTDQVKSIIDRVLTDPDEFIRIAEIIRDKRLNTISPEVRQMIMKALRTGVVYGTWGENEDEMLRNLESSRSPGSELESLGLE